MLLATTCLVTLFLSVATGDPPSTNVQRNGQSSEYAEPTSKDRMMTNAATSDSPALANEVTLEEDGNAPDTTIDELLLFKSLINDEKVFQVNTDSGSKDVTSIDIAGTSAVPVESRVAPDGISLRRQGELNPGFEKKQTSKPSVEFDDSKEEAPPRFGERKRPFSDRVREEAPVLQLTEGGYQRPYQRRPRFRSRQTATPDSSEQSESVQELDRTADGNKQQLNVRRVVPQVTYSAPVQQRPYAFGPVLRPAFDLPPRYVSSVNPIVPQAAQTGFLNNPQTNYLDYPPRAFQTQFSPSNGIGFTNFARDPSITDLYQPSQRNPFENTGLLFQGAPQMQRIFIDPVRNRQPQFPSNNLPVYPNLENTEDRSRTNFAQHFNNPSVNPQFQVPPNFYGGNSYEELNSFNNPTSTFLTNYPSSNDNRFSSQFFRHPVAPNVQQHQQNMNDQQPASDDSQEDKRVKEEGSTNPDNPVSAHFGTRVQAQREDVFIRYPTNEAGYAIEENLPPQNASDKEKDIKQSVPDITKFPSRDPYRDALDSIRRHRQNDTRQYLPEEIFRDVPVDFGYQRPQSPVFLEYPDRQRDMTLYPTPDFDSRGLFDSISPAAENTYPFLDAADQKRDHLVVDKVPSCAKNNVSFCFEDSEYPRNDILNSVNSNPFLMDRLSLAADLRLESVSLVEQQQNSTQQQGEESSYACAVDTKYGSPRRVKNLAGSWRVIVNLDRLSQPVRMEVCRSIGDPCSYADPKIQTTCVQKFSLQRLLAWTPDRGIFLDVFKIPVACSCQILKA